MPSHSHPLGEVIVGAVFVLAGVLTMVYRERLEDWFQQYSGARRRRFERTERIYFWAGAWTIVIGLVFVIRGITK